MSFAVVIPARYGSSRLPGKPLADIGGRPMLAHVWTRACRSEADEVIVATDDARVADAARELGASVELTSADHPSGTDRVEEVARARGWADERIVVNVQGDEPLLPPALIDQVAGLLEDSPQAGMATLAEPIADAADVFRSSVVKVVADAGGNALYFSRAPLPWDREAFAAGPPASLPSPGLWRRHLGIYAYRARLLHDFVAWSPAPLERVEALEQLRVLHHGETIRLADALEPCPGGVDTPEDLERVRRTLGPA